MRCFGPISVGVAAEVGGSLPAVSTAPPGRNASQVTQFDLEKAMSLGTIIIIILLLLLVGALPAWPHSKNWGYFPTGGLGIILAIVLVLLLLGRI